MRLRTLLKLTAAACALAAAAMLSGCANPPGLIQSVPSIQGFGEAEPILLLSMTVLRPFPDQVPFDTQLAKSAPVAKGKFKNWQWSVDVRREISPAERASTAAGSCPQFDWNRAFREAYALADYMLGAKPAAVSLRIHLIPFGFQHVDIEAEFFPSTPRLEFTFWNPASLRGLSCAKRHERFVRVAATIFHEIQHVQYADAKSGEGKPAGEKASSFKNEATSECWALAYRLEFPGKYVGKVKISRINGASLGFYNLALDRVIFGGTVEAGGAIQGGVQGEVPWVQLLLRYDLFHYLARVQPQLKRNADLITVRFSDRAAVNDVLGYCRGLTAWTGNLKQQAMPFSQVSHVVFSAPVPESRQASSSASQSRGLR